MVLQWVYNKASELGAHTRGQWDLGWNMGSVLKWEFPRLAVYMTGGPVHIRAPVFGKLPNRAPT